MTVRQRSRWWLPALATAFMVVCFGGDAAAQVVAVDFDGAQAQAIPISGWAVAIIAAILGLAAYRALRSRVGATLRVLVAAAVATSVVTATVHSNWMREAHAAAPSPILNLVTSPALFTIGPEALFNMTMSGAGYQITVVNTAGRPVTITGLSFAENIPEDPLVFYSGSTGPLCAVGLNLASNATCYAYVEASSHFN
jgi:hypothetical protein